MNYRERKQIIGFFRTYELNKKIVQSTIMNTALDGAGVDYSKLRIDSSKGNGNESKTINAIDKSETARKKCKVVEDTITACELDLCYRYEYMEIIEKCLKRRTNESVYYGTNGFAERSFKRRKNEIIEKAYYVAKKEGLL